MELCQFKMFSGIRITVFVVLAFGCVFAAASPGGAGAAQWSAPFPVSSSQKVNGPQMVFLPDGSSTMVWTRQNDIVEVADRTAGGEFEIADELVSRPSDYFAATGLTSNATGTTAVLTLSANRDRRILQLRVRPPGGDFGEPINVVSSDDYLGNSQVGIGPDGTLVVTWSETLVDGTTTNVFAWVMDPSGDSSTTTRLGQMQDYTMAVVAATGPDGTTTALWGGFHTGNLVVHSRTRMPGGNFGPVEDIDPGAGLVEYPKLFVDSAGRSSLYWVSDGFHYVDREPGGPWGTVQTAPNGGDAEPDFDVASLPDGTTLAAWLKNGRIIVSKRTPGGSFPTSQAISDSGSSRPSVAMLADGSSTVIWRGPVDSQNFSEYLIEGSYGDSSGNFATPSEIGETTSDQGRISLGSGVGGTTAFWAAGEPVPNQIGYFDRTPTGFTEPSNLAGTSGTATNPQVALASGVANTIWQRQGPGSASVEQSVDYLVDRSYGVSGTTLGADSSQPDLDSRGNAFHGALAAVWTRHEETGTSIQGAIGDSEAWSRPVDLGAPFWESDPQPAVAVGVRGLATAVWKSMAIAKYPSPPFPILETVDFNSSGPSSTPLSVSEYGEPIDDIDVAAGHDNATSAIVWTGGGGGQIRAVVRRPSQDFSEPVTVSAPSALGGDPVVKVGADGVVFVAWLETDQHRVRMAISRSGSTFGKPFSPPNPSAVGPPQLTVAPDGGFRLAWLQPGGQVRVASGNGIPTRSRMVSGDSMAVSAPTLDTNNGGETAVAWRTNNGDVEAALSTESGAFDPAAKISTGPTTASRPDIAIDDNGTVQAVWVDQSGSVLAVVGSGQTLDCQSLRNLNFKGVRRKARRNSIRVRTSSPGSLVVSANRWLKKAAARSNGKAAASLSLRLKAPAARRLKRKGRLAVTVRVQFQTEGSCAPLTRRFKVKLKRGRAIR